MNCKRLLTPVLMTVVLAFIAGGVFDLTGTDSAVLAQDKKKEKDPLFGKKGTVIGTLTAKGDNFIEVKADGEEKARKYMPEWKGGQPSAGGGLDKDVLKAIRELTVGSRVEVEWSHDERPRVVKVKVLKAAAKEKEKDSK